MTNPQQPYSQQPGQQPAPQYGAAPGQQPYSSQPGVQNPYGAPGQNAGQPNGPGKGLAITALVLGILAFFNGWLPVVGMLFGTAAIIIGIIALKKRQNKVMSLIGIIGGAIGFIFSLIWLIMLIAGGGSYDFSWSV